MTEVEGGPERIYQRRGNDYLREQLGLLRKDPKLRRRLTLLRVECRNCDTVILEVIATRPYWSVVRRGTANEPNPPGLYDRPDGLSNMEWGRLLNQRRHAAGQGNPIRRSEEPGFFPIPREPEPKDLDGTRQLHALCNCAQFSRRMMWLYDRLGERKGGTLVVGVSPPTNVP